MKKAILATMAAVAVMAAPAEYLYWMTGDYAGTLSEGDYAQLYYIEDVDDLGSKGLVDGSREYYWADSTVGYILGVTDLSVLAAAGLDQTALSYFVEIYNSDGTSLYNGLDYGAVATYGEVAAHMGEMDDLRSITPWNIGAIPEPTSGMLALLGAALLGLRRKKKSPADLADDAD